MVVTKCTNLLASEKCSQWLLFHNWPIIVEQLPSFWDTITLWHSGRGSNLCPRIRRHLFLLTTIDNARSQLLTVLVVYCDHNTVDKSPKNDNNPAMSRDFCTISLTPCTSQDVWKLLGTPGPNTATTPTSLGETCCRSVGQHGAGSQAGSSTDGPRERSVESTPGTSQRCG